METQIIHTCTLLCVSLVLVLTRFHCTKFSYKSFSFLPVGKTLSMYTDQGKIILFFSVLSSHSSRRTAAMTNTSA